MGYTNKTSHYDLPQWIAGDKPSWLGDVNTAMLNIDTAIAGADASASAAESSAAAANAQVQAQEAKITKNTTDIQALTENLADTQGEVNNVKTTAEGALPKSGGTMTGNLILNAAPTSDLQAATKKYVDDNSGKDSLPITGGTMTGPLTLNGAPTSDLMAATKKYVDDKAGQVSITPLTINSTGAKLQGNGFVFGGAVVLNAVFSDTSSATNYQIAECAGNPLGLTANQTKSVGYYSGVKLGDAPVTSSNGGVTALYNGTKTVISAAGSFNANTLYTIMCTGEPI
nr:MAG TPA: hypothetical protein [Caudoviricetes sp.]